MPTGGRINRRDKLRSKTLLTNTKDKDNDVKQTDSIKTVSGFLKNAKTKSSKVNVVSGNKIDINESEIISKGLRKFYVCLEDIKLNNENDKDISDKVNVKKMNKTLLKPESIKISTESPKKNDEIVVENLYDTLKRKGRHTKTNNTNNFTVPVVEKVDKLETSIIKIEIPKKRGRKKKEENDAVISNTNQKDELNTTLADKEKVDSKIELDEESSIKQSKLVRRNALTKTQEQKVDIQLIVQKIEIDNESESKSEKSNTDVDLDVDNKKSRARRNTTSKTIENKAETIEQVDEEKSTVQRTRSRLPKAKKPFVVEKEQANPEETKIPGLAMLANIKNRKSQMIKDKEELMSKESIETHEKPQSKSKEITKPIENPSMKIPGLRMLADLKQRKSELIGSSNRDATHEFIKPILPKISDKKTSQSKESEKKPGTDNLSPVANIKPVVVHQVTPIPPRQSAVRKSKLAPMVSDKVPGLLITEELKKRKSEMMSEQSNNARRSETAEKKKPREIAPKIAADSSVVPVNPIAPRQNAARKSKLAPMVSDKVPGLQDTEIIKKRKSESIPEPSPAKIAPKPAVIDSIRAASAASLARGTIHSPTQFSATKSALVSRSETEIDKPKPSKPIQKSATLDSNFLRYPYPPPHAHPDNQDIPSTPSALDSSSANIRFISMKSPVGILSKPSPFKRPISTLDFSGDGNGGNYEDELNSRCKIPKLQTENRRQSVTFNREVSVKEIHGNSFNSVNSDEASVSSDERIDDFEHRLNEEFERVRNKVAEKHNISFSTGTGGTAAGNLHSNEFLKERQRVIGPSAFSRTDSKTSSDLSGWISNRIKIQSNSPPREPKERPQSRAFNFDQSRSGALKKVNPPIANQQKDDFPSNWRSFDQVSAQPPKLGTDSDGDNSMEVDEKEDETSKSKCSIM